MKYFKSEQEAERYFGRDRTGCEIEVEQCEVCGRWTASQADHMEGGIVGPWVDEAGECLFDRVCEDCSELPRWAAEEHLSPGREVRVGSHTVQLTGKVGSLIVPGKPRECRSIVEIRAKDGDTYFVPAGYVQEVHPEDDPRYGKV